MQVQQLADFLLERIWDDSRAASLAVLLRRNLAASDNWWVDGPAARSGKYWIYATAAQFEEREVAEHIARHDPARVIADCRAKRSIVEAALDPHTRGRLDGVLQALALPYADHPDYRQEWRP